MEEWANTTLDPAELTLFNSAFADNNQLWESYRAQGYIISTSEVYETSYSQTYNLSVEIDIAQKIIVLNNTGSTDITMAPSFVQWVDRYDAEVGNPVVIEPTALQSVT